MAIQPTAGDVHVNVPLSNLSVAYFQEESAFVANRVFPTVPVEKQSDRYYVYNRGDMNRDEMTVRAPGAEAEEAGYTLDNTPTYFCDVWALRKKIPDQIRANMDAVLNADMEATRFLVTKAMIKRERVWAANFFTTGKWTSEKAGQATSDSTHVKYWNDPTSTPIEDVRAMNTAVRLAAGGFVPNKLTLGRQVYDVLVDHPDIIDRLKAGQTPNGPAKATRQKLAEIFELDEVLVMDAVYNSAAEGATESNAFIGGKHALLSYAPGAPGLMTPSAGYNFAWTGMFGAGVEGNRIKTYRWEIVASDIVEIEAAFNLKQIGADLGGFFYNAIQ